MVSKHATRSGVRVRTRFGHWDSCAQSRFAHLDPKSEFESDSDLLPFSFFLASKPSRPPLRALPNTAAPLLAWSRLMIAATYATPLQLESSAHREKNAAPLISTRAGH